MVLAQAKFQHKMKIFTINGKLAQAQAIIAPIGYTPAVLDAGDALLDTWIALLADIKELLSAQKKSTNQERAALKVADKEATLFADTVRTLFAGNTPVLTALGLLPQYETVVDPETGESHQVAVRPSRATADMVARWSLMFTNALTLDAGVKAILAAAGWDDARLTAGLGLVTTFANADVAQQQAISAYQAKLADAHAAEAQVREWYRVGSGLCRLAIKKSDPANLEQLLELLGLS